MQKQTIYIRTHLNKKDASFRDSTHPEIINPKSNHLAIIWELTTLFPLFFQVCLSDPFRFLLFSIFRFQFSFFGLIFEMLASLRFSSSSIISLGFNLLVNWPIRLLGIYFFSIFMFDRILLGQFLDCFVEIFVYVVFLWRPILALVILAAGLGEKRQIWCFDYQFYEKGNLDYCCMILLYC